MVHLLYFAWVREMVGTDSETITLRREDHLVPSRLHLNDAAGRAVELVPFHAGELLPWRVVPPAPASPRPA